jgi:hypothetical protein
MPSLFFKNKQDPNLPFSSQFDEINSGRKPFDSQSASQPIPEGNNPLSALAELAQRYRDERNPEYFQAVEQLRSKNSIGYGNDSAEAVFSPYAGQGKSFFSPKDPANMSASFQGPQASASSSMAMGITRPTSGTATMGLPGDPPANPSTTWTGQTLYSESGKPGMPESSLELASGNPLPTARPSLPGMPQKPSLPGFNRIFQSSLNAPQVFGQGSESMLNGLEKVIGMMGEQPGPADQMAPMSPKPEPDFFQANKPPEQNPTGFGGSGRESGLGLGSSLAPSSNVSAPDFRTMLERIDAAIKSRMGSVNQSAMQPKGYLTGVR